MATGIGSSFYGKKHVCSLECHVLGTDRVPEYSQPAHHFMLDTIPIDGLLNFNILTGLFLQFVLVMTLRVLHYLIPPPHLYKTMRPFQLIDRSYDKPPQQPSSPETQKNAIVQSFFNRDQVHCQSSHLKLLYFALKYTQDKQLHRYQHLNLENQCRIVFYNCFC